MDAPLESPLLDTVGLAAILGKSADYWTKEARARRVPHRRIGRSIRFTQDDIDQIVAAAAVAPAPATASGLAPKSAAHTRKGRAR